MPTDNEQTSEDPMSLPDGLDETIEHFLKGCTFNGKKAATGIREEMITRLTGDFKKAEPEWSKARVQVLTVARLSGRLASAYADLDGGKTEITWKHARQGLKDGQEECKQTARAKHCAQADFNSD